MTYRGLLRQLSLLNEEQLDQDVSVALMETSEVLPVQRFVYDWKYKDCSKVFDPVDGVLDDGHPFLTVDY